MAGDTIYTPLILLLGVAGIVGLMIGVPAFFGRK